MVSAKLQFPRMATGENPLILATAKGNTFRHGENHSANDQQQTTQKYVRSNYKPSKTSPESVLRRSGVLASLPGVKPRHGLPSAFKGHSGPESNLRQTEPEYCTFAGVTNFPESSSLSQGIPVSRPGVFGRVTG